jgi:hypothetical protein
MSIDVPDSSGQLDRKFVLSKSPSKFNLMLDIYQLHLLRLTYVVHRFLNFQFSAVIDQQAAAY